MKDTPEGQTHYADDATLKHIGDLERQLAEFQAREKVLRGSLEELRDEQCLKLSVIDKAVIDKALALPQDSTALDKLIAARLDDYYTELMHPSFGLEWNAPDGELYRAHKQGQIDALEEGADNLSKLSEVGVGEFELRRMAQKLREES